jgi:carbon monoxide dehydrogenase subunit G
MDLTHSFTVPTSVDETWAQFQDIGALAECFPGAQVTAVGETDDGAATFEGTCKVKLGPIALVYTGSGSFVERDETAHRFVLEAKGRDKRGNGTAGATVTLTMQPSGSGTDVAVVTDLSVTGKPAQFGRGVMQDVSDKLLGQFVGCLEQRLAADVESEAAAAPPAEPTAPAQPLVGAPPNRPAPPEGQDALDLGATVLPVLVKSYGKQVAIAVLALLGLALLVRAVRSRSA